VILSLCSCFPNRLWSCLGLVLLRLFIIFRLGETVDLVFVSDNWVFSKESAPVGQRETQAGVSFFFQFFYAH